MPLKRDDYLNSNLRRSQTLQTSKMRLGPDGQRPPAERYESVILLLQFNFTCMPFPGLSAPRCLASFEEIALLASPLLSISVPSSPAPKIDTEWQSAMRRINSKLPPCGDHRRIVALAPAEFLLATHARVELPEIKNYGEWRGTSCIATLRTCIIISACCCL